MMLKRFDPFYEFGIPTTHAGRSFLAADVYRKGDTYFVEIDAPGVRLDDIDIEMEKKHLTVTVERRELADEDRTRVVRGRPTGRFARRFFLGDSLDGESVDATFENGVLTVAIPVIEQAKARKITITAGAAELEV